jgi:hypothetical protein
VQKGIQSQLSFKGRKLQRSDLMRQSLKQQAMRINASLLDCKFLKRHWAEPKRGAGAKRLFLRQGMFATRPQRAGGKELQLFFRMGI